MRRHEKYFKQPNNDAQEMADQQAKKLGDNSQDGRFAAQRFMKKANKEGFSGEVPPELFVHEEWNILTEPEVQKGIKRLKFKHPLADKPVWKIIPAFKLCRRAMSCCLGEMEDNSSALEKSPSDVSKEASEVKSTVKSQVSASGRRDSKWQSGQRTKNQLKDFKRKQKKLRKKIFENGQNKEQAFR